MPFARVIPLWDYPKPVDLERGSMLSDSGVNTPSNRPIECSFSRYAWMTSGCSCAKNMLLGVDRRSFVGLKPILKPSLMPAVRDWASPQSL